MNFLGVGDVSAGQSNDAIFQQARAGRVTCKVDSVAAVEEEHIVLGSGERVRADVIVAAYGLKYQADPEFLKELGIGELQLFPHIQLELLWLILLSSSHPKPQEWVI